MANFWDNDATVSPIDAALSDEGVSGPLANLARSIYTQESSSGKNTETSNAGAVGGMQVTVPTFAGVADKGWDINNPVDNARAGVRYLKQMWDESGGNPRLAAIGYYGGPGAIAKAKQGVSVSDPRNPDAPNTFQYAEQVLSRIGSGVANALLPAANAAETSWTPPASDKIVSGSWQPPASDKVVSSSGAPSASSADTVTSTAPNGDSVTLHYGAQQPAAPPQPSSGSGIDALARQLGLTGRAALNGIASIPNMLWNGPANAINQLAGTNIPLADSNATADFLGLPKPQGGTEQFAQDVASSMAVPGGMGLLGKIGDAATPVTKSVMGLLGDRIGSQVATAALGSGAASGLREAGAGPTAQTVGGLLAGALPMVGAHTIPQLIRQVAVGGEPARQDMLNTIRQFNAVGATPTLGQATQNRIPRAIESVLARAPGGAGIMANKATQQASDMQGYVNGLVNDLSGNAGAVAAGESVANGLQGFKQGVKDLQGNLYGALDQFIPNNTPILTARTQAALHDLNQSIAGAENVSKMFQNSKIAGILSAFEKDLQASAQPKVQTGFGGIMSPAPPSDLAATTLPYESIKKLRTLVGQEIDNSNFTSDIPRSKWRALYGALSQDLGDAATNAGPQAQQAWNWANAFTRSQMGRLDDLSSVIGKDSPEKVFQAAMSGSSEGDTILKRVVSAIPKDNRRDLAATVISRMGRATPGNQNDLGDMFSPSTFLTNWNRMSPAAKQTLFGRIDRPGLLGDLGDLASVASNIRDGSKVFANPSGTSAALAANSLGTGAGLSLLTGHPLVAGAALAPIPIANGIARLMTSPGVVNWFSNRQYLPPGFGLGLLAAQPKITSGLLSQH